MERSEKGVAEMSHTIREINEVMNRLTEPKLSAQDKRDWCLLQDAVNELGELRKQTEKGEDGGANIMSDDSILTLEKLVKCIFHAFSGGKDIINYTDERYAFVLHEGKIYQIDKQHRKEAEKL